MEKIIWTDSSKESLNKIWEFYAERSELAAEKVLSDIFETMETIHFNMQYQQEIVLGESYRRAICHHFKIIYKVMGNQIAVLKVFDSRQEPNKLSIK